MDNILMYDTCYDRFKDKLYLKYKNVDTNEKSVKVINNPKIPVYLRNGEVKDYIEFDHIDNLERHEVSYKDREFELATLIKNYHFKKRVMDKETEKKYIHLDKRLMGSDIDIRDYMIMQYMDLYKVDGEYTDSPPLRGLHTGYLDFEWDIKVSKDSRKQPINIGTYVDDYDNTVYTYALRDPKYNTEEVEGRLEEVYKKLVDMTHNMINDAKTNETIKDKLRDRLNKLKYKAIFVDEEEILLRAIYSKVTYDCKPDFLNIYNAAADINQTLERCKKLHIDPKDLFCHKDVGDYYYFNTHDARFNPKGKRHNYDTASYTKIIDSMIQFFSLRSDSDFAKFGLDAVSEEVLGFGKLDYSHICDHIGDLVYESYETFFMYNIIDVIVMLFINDITDDSTSMLIRRFIVRTEYDRVYTPTKCVVNTFSHLCLREGYVFGNEVNAYLLSLEGDALQRLKERDNKTYKMLRSIVDREAIEGGLVSSPNLFKREGIPLIEDFKNTKFHGKTIDIDASSQYPSETCAGAIFKSNLIGKVTGLGDKTNKDTYKLPERVASSIFSRDLIELGSNLFNLPTIEEIMKVPKIESVINKKILKIDKENIPLLKALTDINKKKFTAADVASGVFKSTGYFYTFNNDRKFMVFDGTLLRYEFKLPDNPILDKLDIKNKSVSEILNVDSGYYLHQTNTHHIEHDTFIEYEVPVFNSGSTFNEELNEVTYFDDNVIIKDEPTIKLKHLKRIEGEELNELMISNSTYQIKDIPFKLELHNSLIPIRNKTKKVDIYYGKEEDSDLIDVKIEVTTAIPKSKYLLFTEQYMKVLNY